MNRKYLDVHVPKDGLRISNSLKRSGMSPRDVMPIAHVVAENEKCLELRSIRGVKRVDRQNFNNAEMAESVELLQHG